MFFAADVRARRGEVVKVAAERAREKMVDMQAIGRATGNRSAEIVEGLPRRDHEWEDDDETLQTRNYTGMRRRRGVLLPVRSGYPGRVHRSFASF